MFARLIPTLAVVVAILHCMSLGIVIASSLAVGHGTPQFLRKNTVHLYGTHFL